MVVTTRPEKTHGLTHVALAVRDPARSPPVLPGDFRCGAGKAIDVVRAAGGVIRDHGEFVPGEPYVLFTDPDGYEVEIWYELPTPRRPAGRSG